MRVGWCFYWSMLSAGGTVVSRYSRHELRERNLKPNSLRFNCYLRDIWHLCLIVHMLLVAGCSRETPPSTSLSATDPMLENVVHDSTDTDIWLTELAISPADLNTVPRGQIGSDSCRECHQERFEAYTNDAHYRSAAWLGEHSARTGLTSFVDQPTGRKYEVIDTYEGRVHRESIYAATGEVVAINIAQPSLRFGSGTHAHSYLFQRDGYFIQSPITFYSPIDAYGLSPGYDPQAQATFDRSVTAKCAYCHVGSLRTWGNYLERFQVAEASIGCERCHGAGAGHVARYRSKGAILKSNIGNEEVNDEIVNPAHLDRQHSQAICAQCHLQGIASVTASGANVWDFRPGELLSRLTTTFQLQGPQQDFKIVGHVEQLEQSACYLGDSTLTCISCHSPHAHEHSRAPVDLQQQCLQCHESQACGVSELQRQQTQGNHCTVCHMPRRDTNVPHAALHDHRIGIHQQSFELAGTTTVSLSDSTATEPTRLVAIGETAAPEIKTSQRRRALAFHSLFRRGLLPEELDQQWQTAQQELLSLSRAGDADPAVLVATSDMYVNHRQFEPARQLAERALQLTEQSDSPYLAAHELLAQIAFQAGDSATALQHYRELTKLRLVTADLLMLGICESNCGDLAAAIQATERALQLDPTLIFAHEQMIQYLRAQGSLVDATRHQHVIARIRKMNPPAPQ